MKKPVSVSVNEVISNTIQSMERVSSAILSGSPASISDNIKGKKVTSQFSLNVKDPSLKEEIQNQTQKKIYQKVFQENAVILENEIKKAMHIAISNMLGLNAGNITVFGKPIGRLGKIRQIENEPFAKWIQSKQGAGEVGLQDPRESLEQLKYALVASISIDVTVTHRGPKVKLKFDQKKLLKLTPHPDATEPGPKGPFFSWLSLVTGPDFVSSISGYSLVTVKDMMQKSRKLLSGKSKSALGNMKSIRGLNDLMKISRTASNAGNFAAVMLSNVSKNGRKSPAEFAGGKNKDYSPSKSFDGFWDKWWSERRSDMAPLVNKIMIVAIKTILTQR